MTKEIVNLGNFSVMRVTKKKARNLFLNNKEVFALASKLRPCFGDDPLCTLAKVIAEDATKTPEAFEKFCNHFRYYNCSAETGMYIKFYTTYEYENE